MKKKDRKRIELEIAVTSIGGEPETAIDLVRKYGTYEIQPTADTVNDFPTIAQGLSAHSEKPTKANDAKPEK